MKQVKAKAGRPRLPKGEATVVKTYRCLPKEYDAYKQAARLDGLKVSEWVRQALNKAVNK